MIGWLPCGALTSVAHPTTRGLSRAGSFRDRGPQEVFGRDDETAALADLVRRTDQGIVVLGASGSGKSSLVRPALGTSRTPGRSRSCVPAQTCCRNFRHPQTCRGQPPRHPTSSRNCGRTDDRPSVRPRSTALPNGPQTLPAGGPGGAFGLLRPTWPTRLSRPGPRQASLLVPSMGAAAPARTITGPAERVGSSCAPGWPPVVHDPTLNNPDLQAVLPHLSHTRTSCGSTRITSQLTLARLRGRSAGSPGRQSLPQRRRMPLSASQQELAQGALAPVS